MALYLSRMASNAYHSYVCYVRMYRVYRVFECAMFECPIFECAQTKLELTQHSVQFFRYHHRKNTIVYGRTQKKAKGTAHHVCTRTAIHILGNLSDGLLKHAAVHRQPRGLGLDDPRVSSGPAGGRLLIHPQLQSCIRAIDTHSERQDTQGMPRSLHRRT